MGKQSDVISEITQNIINSKQTDKETGIVESDTTSTLTDILVSVIGIDSLD